MNVVYQVSQPLLRKSHLKPKPKVKSKCSKKLWSSLARNRTLGRNSYSSKTLARRRADPAYSIHSSPIVRVSRFLSLSLSLSVSSLQFSRAFCQFLILLVCLSLEFWRSEHPVLLRPGLAEQICNLSSVRMSHITNNPLHHNRAD